MEINLADIFESIVDVIPNHPAVVCNRSITYAELDERSNRLASVWKSQGIGHGDHIGLLLYNSTEFVEAMVAALKLRAVPVNLNYRYVAHELVYMFDNANLVGLVYERELSDTVAAALAESKPMRTLIAVDSGDAGGESSRGGWVGEKGSESFEDVVERGSPDRMDLARSGDDIIIMYTGGTTGMPRGVLWQHRDLLYGMLQGGAPGGLPIESAEEIAENVDPDNTMIILPAAPMIHGSSMFSCWIAMFTGGTTVMVHGRSYDAEKMCQLISENNVSVLSLVGDAMARPLVDALVKLDGKYDLDCLAVITSQGALLSGGVRAQIVEQLPDAMILNNFGTSESGHQGEAFYEGDGEDAKPRWIMNERTCVLGDDLVPVEPGDGRIGRLATSGHIPIGYYNDPVKTAKTFVEVDGVRWVIAGDRAMVDEEGVIVFLGRGSQCINSGGEKVYPEEVEEALKAHPGVFDALVVGVSDERWGSRVEAVVAMRPEHPFDQDSIDTACRERVAGYKAPRGYHVVDAVPRHPNGKPDYKRARAIALGEA